MIHETFFLCNIDYFMLLTLIIDILSIYFYVFNGLFLSVFDLL